jgi:23S rRNA (cytidine1920-2'-O)/16S rRNA (cytidine1409-2'-O)-methyltransferase
MPDERLDLLLVARGLAETRALAQRLIMAGEVTVGGETVYKPSRRVPEGAEVALVAGPRYVSRGGEKLEAALDAFALRLDGWVCADVGASTGGFTDCLLQRGAGKVFAIDVGEGILHWRLRKDRRVVVLEGINARHLQELPEPVDLVTIDASFISLRLLLPVVAHWLGSAGQAVVLVKPQFEAGRKAAARGGGVIRDAEVHRQILEEVLAAAEEAGLAPQGLIVSPLRGPKGNVEFLAWCRLGAHPADIHALVDGALRGLSGEDEPHG